MTMTANVSAFAKTITVQFDPRKDLTAKDKFELLDSMMRDSGIMTILGEEANSEVLKRIWEKMLDYGSI